MQKRILITGATGFLGSYIARELLLQGHIVYALARTRGQVSARDRVLDAMQFWDVGEDGTLSTDRLTVLEGDVERQNAGLAENHLHDIAQDRLELLHCAACTSFAAADSELSVNTNVRGAQNVLDLALKAGAKAVHLVSTAYVAGDFTALFSETDLDVGQGFHNVYEKTKYEAELLTRRFCIRHSVPLNVFRPGIVMGDYLCGKTTVFSGLYSYFKALHPLHQELSQRVADHDPLLTRFGIREGNGVLILPFRLGLDPQTRKNIVPVDFVARAIAAVIAEETVGTRTFHLTNPNPPTFSWLNTQIHQGLRIDGIQLVPDADFDAHKPNRFERLLNHAIAVYRPYLTAEPNFACTATVKELARLGVAFPELDKHYFLRLVRYAMATDFGKQRSTRYMSTGAAFLQALRQKVGSTMIPNLKTLNAQFSIKLLGTGKTLYLQIQNGILAEFREDAPRTSPFEFALSVQTLEELVRREVTPQGAFFQKRIQITGDIGKALTLAPIFNDFFGQLQTAKP
ncbi:MAG: hypothetical protein A3K18_06465 [Lentisphaerae bacterium RIFOXYA12_64_32]|nr:MAG: hypothetical protein A3K18_06465 [Lentisphaerae bacterium RIFOXYA12_64_32]